MTAPALTVEFKVMGVAIIVLALAMLYAIAEYLWVNRRRG